VRFSHRAEKGGPLDQVEADYWTGARPARLVIAKRVPFLNGTTHSVGNGVAAKIVPAMSGPFAINQQVILGNVALDPVAAGSLLGTVHEVVWLGGGLTQAEEKGVVEYLTVKWGL
jgi:hypothetical protein